MRPASRPAPTPRHRGRAVGRWVRAAAGRLPSREPNSVVVRLCLERLDAALLTGGPGHDHHLDRGVDIAPDRDADPVRPERLDRVLELDLAPVDADLARLP